MAIVSRLAIAGNAVLGWLVRRADAEADSLLAAAVTRGLAESFRRAFGAWAVVLAGSMTVGSAASWGRWRAWREPLALARLLARSGAESRPS